jgi:hypothetical protein
VADVIAHFDDVAGSICLRINQRVTCHTVAPAYPEQMQPEYLRL